MTLKEAFHNYLHTYLTLRDFEKTAKILSPTISLFGTGMDEVSYNYEDSLKLYKRDLEEVSSPIKYTIKNEHFHQISDTVGVVACEFDMSVDVGNHILNLNNLRFTTVWVKKGDEWFMEHKHISLPTNLHGGDEAYPIKEILEKNEALQKLVDQKTEELNNALLEMTNTAITDKLTSLFNRRKIEESLTCEIERARRYDKKFSIILTDIDHFKDVNDTFGHPIGDKTLIEFTKILSSRIRKTDICGRWGGEEFIILCPETSLNEAVQLANEIRKRIEEHHFESVGKKTASFGVTEFRPTDTSDTILSRVDKLLYKAKQNGRNRVESE